MFNNQIKLLILVSVTSFQRKLKHVHLTYNHSTKSEVNNEKYSTLQCVKYLVSNENLKTFILVLYLETTAHLKTITAPTKY